MNKYRSLTALTVVAAALVVLAGGLMASNMGFKLNKSLVAGGAGSKSGTQTIAMPYNRQVGIDNASELFADVGGVFNIQKFLTATDTTQFYTFGSPDFGLEEGVGYLIQMSGPTNYIIVGSHNPSATVQLQGPGAASKTGSNLYAPPYHSTASQASELFAEIGASNVQNIQKYLTATDTTQFYSFGSPDFAITPGEAYIVKMGQTLAYSPSHY